MLNEFKLKLNFRKILDFIFKNHLKLISYILLCILIYLIFKSEFVHSGLKREYYLKYIIIFLCFFLFLKFIKKFKNKFFFKYIIIIVYSSLFSLYSFEAFLIFKNHLNLKSNYDMRSRYEIYNDLKKYIYDIVLSYHPGVGLEIINKDIYPLAGISNKETIHCNELGYYNKYYSDKHGFNNSENKYHLDKISYVLIGDSFVHGACVDILKNISSQFEKIINKKQENETGWKDKVVLNLGITSSGPLIQYAILREYLPKNVENILYFYYEGNDLFDLSGEIRDPILQKYYNLNFSQNLILRQEEVDTFIKNTMQIQLEEWEKKYLIYEKNNTKYLKILKFIKLNSLREKLTRPKAESYHLTDNITVDYRNILKLMIEENKIKNSKFYFIYLPELKRYKNPTLYNFDNYEIIKKIAKEFNIAFIDMHEEIFSKEKFPTKLFPNEIQPHYTPEGYALVAEKLAEIINKNKIK